MFRNIFIVAIVAAFMTLFSVVAYAEKVRMLPMPTPCSSFAHFYKEVVEKNNLALLGKQDLYDMKDKSKVIGAKLLFTDKKNYFAIALVEYESMDACLLSFIEAD
jgi:hypothetical protein